MLSKIMVVSIVISTYLSVQSMASEPVKIMPLGDSITKGNGSTNYTGYRKSLYLNLINSGYNIDFVGSQNDGNFPDTDHEGHAGWHADKEGTTNDIVGQVYGWLTDNPADIILLHIGTNDISVAGQNAAEISDILDEIEQYELDSGSEIIVILARIINRRNHDCDNTMGKSVTTAFNDDVEDMANIRISNGDKIIVVDMECNAGIDYVNDLVDDLHPNDTGYSKMANVWFNALTDFFFLAPQIISEPVTTGIANQLYIYDVDATGNPDPNYILTTFPEGMTIEPNGLIEWIPPEEGYYDIMVKASNGHILDANQSFTIAVSDLIAFDAVSSNSSSTNGFVLSWSHTVESGDNRILMVGAVAEDNKINDLTISSVDYNGISLNVVADSNAIAGTGVGSDRIKSELYYLLAPPVGTGTITVAYAGNVSKRCAGAISLKNVQQQHPEAVCSNSASDSNSISTNIVTLTDGAWVVDVIGGGNQLLFIPGHSQVERFDISSDSSAAAGSTLYSALAGQRAISWGTDSVLSNLVHSGVAVAPKQPDSFDMDDLLLLAQYWLQTGIYGPPDYNGDNEIDLADFVFLAGNWFGD